MTPGLLDHVFLVMSAVVFPWWAHRSYPDLQHAVAMGERDARLASYRETMLWEWSLSLLLCGGWLVLRRPFEVLGLGIPSGWGFWVVCAVAIATTAFLVRQLRLVARDPEARRQARAVMREVAPVLPGTAREMRRFAAVSVTAGVCEELLYRGFQIWYWSALLGPVPAVVLSSLLFAAGHLYQGPRNLPKVFLVGAASAGLYLLAGSLWPVMFLHAAVDLLNGWLGHLAFLGEVEDAPEEPIERSLDGEAQ